MLVATLLLALPALGLQHASEDCAAEHEDAALTLDGSAGEGAGLATPTCDDPLWHGALKDRGEQCCSSAWGYLGMSCPYVLHKYSGFGDQSSSDYRTWWRKWCSSSCSQCQTGCCCPRASASGPSADLQADLAAAQAAAAHAAQDKTRQWDVHYSSKFSDVQRMKENWKREQEELLRRTEQVKAEAEAAMREHDRREQEQRAAKERKRQEQRQRKEAARRAPYEAAEAFRKQAEREEQERRERARAQRQAAEVPSASQQWTRAQQATLKQVEAVLRELKTKPAAEQQREMRKLAKKWHPDRVPEEEREFATHVFQHLNYQN